MTWSIGKKIGSGFGLALVMLATVGAVSYDSTTKLVESAGWVQHTHEVLNGLVERVVGDEGCRDRAARLRDHRRRALSRALPGSARCGRSETETCAGIDRRRSYPAAAAYGDGTPDRQQVRRVTAKHRPAPDKGVRSGRAGGPDRQRQERHGFHPQAGWRNESGRNRIIGQAIRGGKPPCSSDGDDHRRREPVRIRAPESGRSMAHAKHRHTTGRSIGGGAKDCFRRPVGQLRFQLPPR